MGFRKINCLWVVIIAIIGISSSMLTARAVTIYSPAVQAGQWARYETLYDRCEPANSPSCQGQGSGSFNDTDYGLIQILDVPTTNVTLRLFTQYKNGTTSTEGALVNVATGAANVTSFGNGAVSNYFVLAGGLTTGDHIWDTLSAPTFNQTLTEQFLGYSRTLNFLNHTSSFGYPGFSVSESTGFVFDQQSGLFVEVSFNITTTNAFSGNTQTAFALGMTDNNVWRSSILPDFSISPIASMNFAEGASDSTTVTITGDTGFTTRVGLTVNTPSGISCFFRSSTIQGSGSTTLTCNGQPGTYDLTISAISGYSSHSAQTTATINFAPSFSINTIPPITFQTGSSGTAAITLAGQYGFSSDITLTLTVPSGLTCTLDHSVIHGSGTATLTCTGQPGTYIVKMKAASGTTAYDTQTTVTVNSAPASNQPASSLPLSYIYAGVAVAVVAAIAAIVFFVRRKPSPQKQNSRTQSNTMPPS